MIAELPRTLVVPGLRYELEVPMNPTTQAAGIHGETLPFICNGRTVMFTRNGQKCGPFEPSTVGLVSGEGDNWFLPANVGRRLA